MLEQDIDVDIAFVATYFYNSNYESTWKMCTWLERDIRLIAFPEDSNLEQLIRYYKVYQEG